MPRNTSVVGFPPFRGSLRNLIIVSTVIYITLVLLQAFQPEVAKAIYALTIFSPDAIRHWWLWQFVTYGFVDVDPRSFLFTMLSVFFLGSAVQERFGSKAFLEMYISSFVCAGILGFLFSFAGVHGAVWGAGVAANAILMVFYLLNRDAPIMLLFIPIPIPVKYIVIFTAAVEAVYFLIYHFPLFFLALLLGMVSGFLWFRFAWRRAALFGAIGNQMGSLRNNYHRWKRRRAGRKFQVYMKKHGQDPKDYFDEYGNFRPPDDKEKGNGGSKGGGWVN